MNAKLALALANAYAGIEDAVRPKDRQLAAAKFDGMCIAAHAMGMGMTPQMVHMWVMDAIRAIGPRPTASAWNVDRKAWVDAVVPSILRNAGSSV